MVGARIREWRELRPRRPSLPGSAELACTVMCGGGDGTLVNVMNHVFRYIDEANEWRTQRSRHFGERQTLLPYPEFGILKLGTGNGLSNVVSAKNATEDLLKVLSGPRHNAVEIDLIEAEGQRFFFAGQGYDARILNDYNAIKNWAARSKAMKRLTATAAGYLMAVLGKTVPHMLRHGFNNEVRVTNLGDEGYFMDPVRGDRAIPVKSGQVIYEGPAGLCGVGTAPFFGFGFTMFPFAGVRPGFMNMRVATCGPLKPLANLPSLWKGNWRDAEVLDFMLTKVKVESKNPVPYQHSGDGMGARDSITYSISDRPLKLVDYKGQHYDSPVCLSAAVGIGSARAHFGAISVPSNSTRVSGSIGLPKTALAPRAIKVSSERDA